MVCLALPDPLVIVAVNKAVCFLLILQDPEFVICIILKAVFIPVQMVGSNVGQDGNIGPELMHIIQLEATQFQYIVVIILPGHLPGETLSEVTAQSGIQSCTCQQVVG